MNIRENQWPIKKLFVQFVLFVVKEWGVGGKQ